MIVVVGSVYNFYVVGPLGFIGACFFLVRPVVVQARRMPDKPLCGVRQLGKMAFYGLLFVLRCVGKHAGPGMLHRHAVQARAFKAAVLQLQIVGHTGFGRLSTVEAGNFHFVIQPLGRADIGDAGIDGGVQLVLAALGDVPLAAGTDARRDLLPVLAIVAAVPDVGHVLPFRAAVDDSGKAAVCADGVLYFQRVHKGHGRRLWYRRCQHGGIFRLLRSLL